MVLYLNKLEFSSPKEDFCQVWLIRAKWFWRRFLNFVDVFSLFRNYLPLEKGGRLHMKKIEFPSSKDAFVPSLIEIGSVVLEKKICNFCQCIFAIS